MHRSGWLPAPGRTADGAERSVKDSVLNECVCAQLCPTLCDPTNCGPPGSSVHGILQARILEWVAVPSSRGSSRPRDRTQVSCISCFVRQVLYHQRHRDSALLKGINKYLEFTEQENLGSKTRSERFSMRTRASCVCVCAHVCVCVCVHARVCVCARARVCVKSLRSSGQSRWTFSLNQILKDHGWFFSETIIHGLL